MKKFLELGMLMVVFLAFLAPLFPFILWFSLSPTFSQSLIFSFAFSLIIVEKLYVMLLRNPDRDVLRVDKDWTAVTVGVTYTLTMYAVIIEFYWRSAGVYMPWATVLGSGLYGVALLLRYWSFYHLAGQWTVHLDRSEEIEQRLIRSGPYGIVRHPLYLGACLECLAIPLMFNSFWALLIGAVTFVPLEIQRAIFEERFLYSIFGSEYEAYAREIPAFIPGLEGRSRGRK